MFHRLFRTKASLVLAVFTALLLPIVSLAETTASTSEAAAQAGTPTPQASAGIENAPDGRGRNIIDIHSLTDAQKTTYQQAVALYEQVEDQVLGDLVTAGVVTQADVDAYAALRADQKALNDMDKTTWTAAQYKAYYEANSKTGDERKTAMQALADSGLITQEQADALASDNATDLWNTMTDNASTNTAIQTALSTMRQARQTMQETLIAAGINGIIGASTTDSGMNGGLRQPDLDGGSAHNRSTSQNSKDAPMSSNGQTGKADKN